MTPESVEKKLREIEEELCYLRWFMENMDFGPAHGDVVDVMNEQYTEETGNEVPEGWKDDE